MVRLYRRFQRGWKPFPPIAGASKERRASLRMPSDEALRVDFGMHATPAPFFTISGHGRTFSIHRAPKGVWERDVTLAVPPPQFDVPGPLTRSTTPGSSYPPRLSQLPRHFFSRCHGSPRLDFQRVLGDSEEAQRTLAATSCRQVSEETPTGRESRVYSESLRSSHGASRAP